MWCQYTTMRRTHHEGIQHRAHLILIHWGQVMHTPINGLGQHCLKVMVCQLFTAKPLPDQKLRNCQFGPQIHITSVNFVPRYHNVQTRKYTWKWCLLNGRHFIFCLNVLTLKLGNIFQNVILFSNVIPYECNISVTLSNWSKTWIPLFSQHCGYWWRVALEL